MKEERFEQRWLLYHSDFRNWCLKPLGQTSNKRRGRDSNPRDPFEPADLANRCLQPLGHLSEIVAIHDLQPRPDCRLKLQRCRLITLHGRCYLPRKFSTFPISSVGGERGIRTPGGCYTPTIFKTAAFNHSATSPNYKVLFWVEQNKTILYLLYEPLCLFFIKITKNYIFIYFCAIERNRTSTYWGFNPTTLPLSYDDIYHRFGTMVRTCTWNHYILGSGVHHHFIGVLIKVAI